ncbi:hypothetical protein [Rhodococcus sp. USK13]|uniref:hypothetical protein n=1 Tax=Rhodococcus sp. USK13 TaxID=2806442 RepID=UPI001BD02986|nr:hypothetical protein [Rhodococcus sp. USK13]
MDAYAPTSRTVSFLWDRVRYELLDRRASILAELDTQKLLQGFNATHDSLTIQLRDRRTVDVSLKSVSVHEHIRAEIASVSSSEVAELIGHLLGAVRAIPQASFQHLVGWPEDIDSTQAYAQGATAIVNDASELGVSDFALLIDGAASDVWIYQAEVGIINREEAPDRVTRVTGRSPAPRPASQPDLEDVTFPQVATFVDSFWQCTLQKPIPLADASDLVTTVTPEACRLVEALHARLRGTQLK